MSTKFQIILIIVLLIALGIVSYLIVNLVNSSNNNMSDMQNPGDNMSQTSSNITYSANTEITEDAQVSNETYSSSESDENALLVTGDVDVSVSNSSITKTGSSDGGDNTSFYGINSAILAKNGANLELRNLEITTDAQGGNGVFSYGGSAQTNNTSSDGTTVTISNSNITTMQDNSGGIMTTGGGTTIANDLNVSTLGTSSAAIRTDRGGGTVTVNKGTYVTDGKGSPAIYSTANVSVTDATLQANASEGIVIEGKNSVEINNCTLIDTNNELNGQSTTYKNIFLYQSMSGDADEGSADFKACDSNITTNSGDTFYVTNTTASITLKNNTIVNYDESGYLLKASKDSWGNEGSNGGEVTFKFENQKAEGNIYIDSISKLSFSLAENSEYTGTINGENTAKEINLTLDSTSKIKLTEDSYVTSLTNEVEDNSNIDFNGFTLYVNGVAIN